MLGFPSSPRPGQSRMYLSIPLRTKTRRFSTSLVQHSKDNRERNFETRRVGLKDFEASPHRKRPSEPASSGVERQALGRPDHLEEKSVRPRHGNVLTTGYRGRECNAWTSINAMCADMCTTQLSETRPRTSRQGPLSRTSLTIGPAPNVERARKSSRSSE